MYLKSVIPCEISSPDKALLQCTFLVLLAAKSWRIKENFPLARTDASVIIPLLAIDALEVLVLCEGIGGGNSVKRNSFSMRII